MSNAKADKKSKTGLLTGLVIVTTGFVAGFQGLDLLMATDAEGRGDAASMVGLTPPAVDRIVTGSIAESLVKTGQMELSRLFTNIGADETANPRVARLGKGDRNNAPIPSLEERAGHVTGGVSDHVVTRRRQAAKQAVAAKIKRSTAPASKPAPTVSKHAVAKSKPTPVAPVSATKKRAEPQTAQMAPAKPTPHKTAVVSANKATVSKKPDANEYLTTQGIMTPTAARAQDLPYVDRAEMALFAADMPLPARLANLRRLPADAPLATGQSTRRDGKSPLKPHLLATGKAFGGLSEIEFQRRERRCMTTALYFEARSESSKGQIAVGQVIMNRVRSPEYPDTICGVVWQGSQRRTGCQFSFTCDGKADRPTNEAQWERSKKLSDDVLEGRVWLQDVGNATHYHANYVSPRWRRSMVKRKRIGHHIFYKSPEVSTTDTYQKIADGKP